MTNHPRGSSTVETSTPTSEQAGQSPTTSRVYIQRAFEKILKGERLAFGISEDAVKSGYGIGVIGGWGVGKTELWKRALRSVSADPIDRDQVVSYVSLSGLKSAEEMRRAVYVGAISVETMAAASEGGKAATSLKSIGEKIRQNIGTLTDALFKQENGGPLAQAIAGVVAEPLLLAAVTGGVVVVDDIERRHGDLKISQVFGMVSELIELRRCRVIVILNEDQLQEAGEFEDVRAWQDKTLSRCLRLSPSPEESLDLIFEKAQYLSRLDPTERTKVFQPLLLLKISNLRILRRVLEFGQEMEAATGDESFLTTELPVLLGLTAMLIVPRRKDLPTREYLQGCVEMFGLGIIGPKAQSESYDPAWPRLLMNFPSDAIDRSYQQEFLAMIHSGIIDSHRFHHLFIENRSAISVKGQIAYVESLLREVRSNTNSDSVDKLEQRIKRAIDIAIGLPSTFRLRDLIDLEQFDANAGGGGLLQERGDELVTICRGLDFDARKQWGLGAYDGDFYCIGGIAQNKIAALLFRPSLEEVIFAFDQLPTNDPLMSEIPVESEEIIISAKTDILVSALQRPKIPQILIGTYSDADIRYRPPAAMIPTEMNGPDRYRTLKRAIKAALRAEGATFPPDSWGAIIQETISRRETSD